VAQSNVNLISLRGRQTSAEIFSQGDMQRLHIRGLVQISRQVQQKIADGLASDDAQHVQRFVQDTLHQVDALCQKYATTPDQLPTPTAKAYQYLKSIDWQTLPPVSPPKKPSPANRHSPPAASTTGARQSKKRTVYRSRSLLAECQQIQLDIETLSRGISGGHREALLEKLPEFVALHAQIQSAVKSFETSLKRKKITPQQLTLQSQRAYRWLKSLSKVETLMDHLQTVKTALKIAKEWDISANRLFKPGANRIHFMLSPTAALIRSQKKGSEFWITVSEGFRAAPLEIIRPLVRSVFVPQAKEDLAKIKAYSRSDSFKRILMELEPVHDAQGNYFNLEDIFARVNSHYFANQLQKPRLRWNERLTLRKLAHYELSTDTIMVSRSFDQPDTPVQILEFLMYHEMLHKHLGVKTTNGRSYAHSKRFKDAEQRFENYAEVQTLIQEHLKKIKRLKR